MTSCSPHCGGIDSDRLLLSPFKRHVGRLTDSSHAVGEINTLQGNLNWVASREHSLTNPAWKGREEELLPLCSGAESDSANLDHVAELLMRTGVPAEESLMILVPEAYDNHPDLQKHYPEVWPVSLSLCKCKHATEHLRDQQGRNNPHTSNDSVQAVGTAAALADRPFILPLPLPAVARLDISFGIFEVLRQFLQLCLAECRWWASTSTMRVFRRAGMGQRCWCSATANMWALAWTVMGCGLPASGSPLMTWSMLPVRYIIGLFSYFRFTAAICGRA